MGRSLTPDGAVRWIADFAFRKQQVGRVGVELEWLVVDESTPGRRVGADEIRRALVASHPLPAAGAVSFEPGGQFELSTAPSHSLAACVDAARVDLATIRTRLRRHGLMLIGFGLDNRPPARVVDLPRYEALERHYDQFNAMGRELMCNSASIQVNVDAGDDSPTWRGREHRWRLANRLGPVLTALFANSPSGTGRRSLSMRQELRFRTDPSRTDPIRLDGDARTNWIQYALDALVVGLPGEAVGDSWAPSPRGMTMRAWLRGGPRPPRLDDLRQHCKTVIPPVRACGHLEMRMIDAQDGSDWVVPPVVVSVLLDDRVASYSAMDIVESIPYPGHREQWAALARDGLTEPTLAKAGRECMEVVLSALHRHAVPDWAQHAVLAFAENYTFRGLCPASNSTCLRQAAS